MSASIAAPAVRPGLDHWIEALLQARRARVALAAHPAQLQCSLPDAYALHKRHLRQWLADSGDRVIGCKIGATTEPAMERLGLTAPLVGPILAGCSHVDGATLARGDFMACIVEPELGVLLGADLDGTRGLPAREALLAAIAAVFPAIEIADSRFAQWQEAPACAIVADLSYAGAWVRGEACAGWRRLDLARLPVELSCDGRHVASGSTANVLGDPLHALALAVADAALRGQVLRAGDVVSTGSCTAPWAVPVDGGGRVVADFGALGRVAVEIRG